MSDLRKALEFYADPKNWHPAPGEVLTAAELDEGECARAALSGPAMADDVMKRYEAARDVAAEAATSPAPTKFLLLQRAEHVREVAAAIDAHIRPLVEEMADALRWIPVGERLPELGKRVRAWTAHDTESHATCDGEVWDDDNWHGPVPVAEGYVTHWQDETPPPADGRAAR